MKSFRIANNILDIECNSDQALYVSFPRPLCSYHHSRFLTLRIGLDNHSIRIIVCLLYLMSRSLRANFA